MKCPFCQAEVPPGERLCPECKVEIPASGPTPSEKCPKCGRALTDRDPSGQFYCKACGLFVPRPGTAPPRPHQTTAGKSFCSHCGAAVPPASQFCPQCGTKIGSLPEKPAPIREEKAKANLKKGCLLMLIGAFVLGFVALIISVSTCSETIQAVPDLRLEAHRLAWGDYGSRVVIGTIVNTGSRNYSYAQVEINLYDQQGSLVGSTMANINNLGPGQRWKFEAPVIEDRVARYEVKGISAF